MKKMNNSIKFLAMAFSIALVSVFSSCDSGDDDPIIIDEDPVVADGFYILGSATSADPDQDLEFGAGAVGNGEARDGFYAAYVYLAAGDVNFVLYSNNEPTTFGGSVESFPLFEGSEYSYWRGALTIDGAAVTITDAGLYHVRVDLTSELFFLSRVDYFEIIGSATPLGWGAGTELSGTVTAAGGSFTGTNITLRSGEFKFRYNSNWDNNIEDVEGLNIHSNFGVDIVAGGPNIPFDDEDGVYTVTVTYAPGAGESLSYTLTRTGDAEEVTYDPTEYTWGIIGAATSTGWDADTKLAYYDWVTPNATWDGVFYLGADVFKFRTNDTWTHELNPGNSILDASSSITDNGDGNFVNATAGLFYVRISTSDEGETWNLYIKEASPAVIGAAVTNGWDGPDNDLTFVGDVDGTITWKIENFAFAADGWKIRFNDGWQINYGFGQVTLSGANSGVLSDDGGNFKVSTAGSYTVTLSTSDSGATYSVAFD